MKVLHTIHAIGEYSELTQSVHEFDHSDLLLAYHSINQTPEEDRCSLDKFTIQNGYGIFTSCLSVTESYVIIS